jgi:hypothetical protein
MNSQEKKKIYKQFRLIFERAGVRIPAHCIKWSNKRKKHIYKRWSRAYDQVGQCGVSWIKRKMQEKSFTAQIIRPV